MNLPLRDSRVAKIRLGRRAGLRNLIWVEIEEHVTQARDPAKAFVFIIGKMQQFQRSTDFLDLGSRPKGNGTGHGPCTTTFIDHNLTPGGGDISKKLFEQAKWGIKVGRWIDRNDQLILRKLWVFDRTLGDGGQWLVDL